jgi:hypothetical protein
VRPVTDSFLRSIRGAHSAVFRARVLEPGLVGVNPGPLTSSGSPVDEIPLLGGDAVFDTNSDVNGTIDIITQIDWPTSAGSLAAPYGQELYVERGVQYGDGIKEYVGLGYYRIDRVEQARATKGAIRISGSDRMANLRDGRSIAPIHFAAGTAFSVVFESIVEEILPSVVVLYDFDAVNTLISADHVLDQDRLKFLTELVTAYGKIMYFDYAGRLTVKTAPGLENPVWDVNAGRNGVLVSMSRQISRDGVYNGVVATGEPVGELPPVRGVALDLNPASPTFWDGPFGKVPRFFSSSFMTNQQQCEEAAASILAASNGVPYTVSLGVVPNPALEGWDVLNVSFSDRENSEIHIADRITYSLSVEGSMGIETRKQFLEG